MVRCASWIGADPTALIIITVVSNNGFGVRVGFFGADYANNVGVMN